MKWVSYTRSISSRIGEENPSNTIAEQNERIVRYLKKLGCNVSEKYSDRKRTAEATEGFDKLVQDGMARKFDAVVVDSIFRCGRTLPFAIEALQRTFYPLGIQFAVVEDDFCSADKTAEEVAEYFNGKTIDKIRSEFITNRQNHFEEGTLTHRQAKYGYALSEDRRNLVLNPESAQVVKLIFQMYLEDMKIPEIARALDAQGVPSPQIQMAKKKRSRTKIKWPDSTIRLILKNPLYIGKCTLTLAKAKRELEVPAIVSKTEFQKAQKKLESTRLPSRKKARKKPNLLFKKIYDKESGKGLLCRTSEDESQQIYSFDRGYRCFSGKAPFIESEKIFREILSALEKEKMQAAHIDRVLDSNPEKVKQCMDAGLLQYRKRANEIVAHLMAKDDERTAVYREYEQGSISLEQMGNLNNQTWDELWNSPEAEKVRAKVRCCDRDCWMIGSVSPAMHKYIWKPATWVLVHKFKALFTKHPYSMYELKICRDYRDGKVTKEELDKCSTCDMNCVINNGLSEASKEQLKHKTGEEIVDADIAQQMETK